MSKKTRVLIVDDSPTMRKILRAVVESDANLQVVAEAGSASEARDAINAFRPDVMTLDVEMPNMNGIEFLKRVMKHRPMPVVMVSSMTTRGSQAAVDALANGAVECIGKPQTGSGLEAFKNLPGLLHVAASALMRRAPKSQMGMHGENSQNFVPNGRKIFIGGSTGAVEAIETILKEFPENCPPTLITQHMPCQFLASFASRLDPRVRPTVKLAEDNEPLEVGKVLLAPGGAYHLSLDPSDLTRCKLDTSAERNGHRPSVDILFESAAGLGRNAVAAILTGMGNDGAKGLLKMKESGAVTLGQSEESCVVFGMPRVAGELGAVAEWSGLTDIAGKLLSYCSMHKERV